MLPRRDIVVIGGSAGGIRAVTTFLDAMPADFGGSMLAVPVWGRFQDPIRKAWSHGQRLTAE